MEEVKEPASYEAMEMAMVSAEGHRHVFHSSTRAVCAVSAQLKVWPVARVVVQMIVSSLHLDSGKLLPAPRSSALLHPAQFYAVAELVLLPPLQAPQWESAKASNRLRRLRLS